MNHGPTTLPVPLLMVCIVTTAVGCSASGKSAGRDQASPPSAVVLLVPPRTFHRDEPVTVRPILGNTGASPLLYAKSNPRLDWHWRVIDARGVPLSDRGRLPIQSSLRSRELPAGGAEVEQFDLRQLFDLPPGRYDLSAGRRVWKSDGMQPTEVRSAAFSFEVLK